MCTLYIKLWWQVNPGPAIHSYVPIRKAALDVTERVTTTVQDVSINTSLHQLCRPGVGIIISCKKGSQQSCMVASQRYILSYSCAQKCTISTCTMAEKGYFKCDILSSIALSNWNFKTAKSNWRAIAHVHTNTHAIVRATTHLQVQLVVTFGTQPSVTDCSTRLQPGILTCS